MAEHRDAVARPGRAVPMEETQTRGVKPRQCRRVVGDGKGERRGEDLAVLRNVVEEEGQVEVQAAKGEACGRLCRRRRACDDGRRAEEQHIRRGERRRDRVGREIEILALLAARRSRAEIAQRLSISPHTVKNHLSHIYAKLGTQNSREAVKRARSLGLCFAVR
ncbi:MAG: LuxR family transcriptional regulator [Chloroflexia bacterium]|nr:LuxR family transcriptional regulator [Chloroflexia bacterium]